MVYRNIVELQNLSATKLNQAMRESENISLVLNTVLDAKVHSSWYECSRMVLTGTKHLIDKDECAIYVLQKAAGLLITAKQSLGYEEYDRTESDTNVLTRFSVAKDENMGDFRIPGMVELMFRMLVRYATKSFGLGRDYLSKFESAWEAWINMILNCESWDIVNRFEHMVLTAYPEVPERSATTGISPARLKGILVPAEQVKKSSVIESADGVRYYVLEVSKTDSAINLYCVRDMRDTWQDGLVLTFKGERSKKEGWLDCGKSSKVSLIGTSKEYAVSNERVFSNDIKRGDIVYAYGLRYVVDKENEETYIFTSSSGEESVWNKRDVLLNDNIVVTSSLKIPAKKDRERIIFRRNHLELRIGDEISYIKNWSLPDENGIVVYSTDHGAYGVMDEGTFIPLYNLYTIKKIK